MNLILGRIGGPGRRRSRHRIRSVAGGRVPAIGARRALVKDNDGQTDLTSGDGTPAVVGVSVLKTVLRRAKAVKAKLVAKARR